VIILDSNVVSELMRSVPDPAVQAWLRRHTSGDMFTTAITVAEIQYGIARLPDGGRRERLRQAANDVFARFPDKVLPFDLPAAARYAGIVAHRDSVGVPISAPDAQIAAICRVHEATLITRNTRDFLQIGVRVVDPWQAS
jgi:predicted nucleic acid-binding protein